MLDQLHHVLGTRDLGFLHAYDLYLLLAVLQHSQLLLVVQQVEHLHQQPAPYTLQHHQ